MPAYPVPREAGWHYQSYVCSACAGPAQLQQSVRSSPPAPSGGRPLLPNGAGPSFEAGIPRVSSSPQQLTQGLPDGPVIDSTLPMQRAQVRSLVKKLDPTYHGMTTRKKKTDPVSPSLCWQFRARMTAVPKQQGHVPKASLDALPVAARETPAPLLAWTFLPLPLSLHWRHSRHLPPRPPLPTVPTEGTVSPAFPPSCRGWHPQVHAES